MTANMIARTRCPFCERALGQSLYAIPYADEIVKTYLDAFYCSGSGVDHSLLAGAVYELVECKGCKGIYQKQIPDDGLMMRLYESWIDPTATLARHTQQPLHHCAALCAEIMQLLSQIDKPPSQVKVLDFGMGWAEWALAARGFGCNVNGVELSEARIAHARANGLKVVDHDAIPGMGFDLINAEQVFEHIPEPLQDLRHLALGLAPGGIIKINVPDAPNIKHRIRRADWNAPKGARLSLNPVAPLEHINLFHPDTGAEMARLCGLSMIKIPILRQLQCATYWRGRSRILRNLAMPFYRNLLKRKNYYVFGQA